MLMIMIELVIMMITTVIVIFFFLNETVLARAAAGFGFQPGQT